MVGYQHGNHHHTEGIEHGGEKNAVFLLQFYDFPEDAIYEDEGIEGACNEQDSHEYHRIVGIARRYQFLVDEIEGIKDDSKERMARNLEIEFAIRHKDVRPCIKAGYMEGLGEQLPEADVVRSEEKVAVFVEEQPVEQYEYQ